MDADYTSARAELSAIVESVPDPFAAPAEVWSPSTPELIAVAAEVGFSTQDLLQAEHELNEGTLVSATSSSGCTPPSTKRIISALVQHRVKPTPWRGQLPPPRVSPPRTLGDALEVAWRSKSSPCRSGSRHSSTPALVAGATSSSDWFTRDLKITVRTLSVSATRTVCRELRWEIQNPICNRVWAKIWYVLGLGSGTGL